MCHCLAWLGTYILQKLQMLGPCLKWNLLIRLNMPQQSAAGPAAPHAKKGVIRFVVLSSF